MNNLIAELERATEGSRELDAKIAVAAHPLLATFRDDPERGAGHWISDHDGPVYALDYTTSLDAAVMLLPEGLQYGISTHPKEEVFNPGGAQAFVMDMGCTLYVHADSATPALALCIVFLRARQAMEEAA